MAVVANVNAELDVGGIEHRVPGIARLEEELLVKTGVDLRNVCLAVLAEVLSVRVDNRCSIEIHAGHVLFIERHDDYHGVLPGVVLHQLRRWAVGNLLGGCIPLAVLAWTEIGLGKDFLKTQHLHTLVGGALNKGNVCFEHALANLVGRHGAITLQAHLDQAALHFGHNNPRLVQSLRMIRATRFLFVINALTRIDKTQDTLFRLLGIGVEYATAAVRI